MEVTKHANGQFCWAELHTTDGPAAKAFYTALFGWEAQDDPIGEGMVYTMLKIHGANAAAIYEDHSSGAPPNWTTYISVDNLDDAVKKAEELGGTILAGPFDVMEHGRMAAVQDPTGAVFCVWQPKAHIGYSVVGEPGAVCWNELCTGDTAKAEAFYTGLFGYGVKHSHVSIPYTEFQQDGKSLAGMMGLTPDMAGVPPHWTIYFTVADCQATFEKAKQLGADTIIPPMPVPDVGTMAMMKDPQGAVFAFIG